MHCVFLQGNLNVGLCDGKQIRAPPSGPLGNIDLKFDLSAHLEHINTMFHPAWKQAKLQPRDHSFPLVDTFIGLLCCCNKTKMENVMCCIMFIDFFPELKAKF